MPGRINWSEMIGWPALKYPVPRHADSLWYSLGGLTLVCFIISLVTGVVLTQFYNPNPAVAHQSVKYIASTPFLGFVRSLHRFSADFGFALIIAHLLRVLLTGAFRPPRTVNYLIGLGLLFTSFQLFFTGSVLKWDQEGYEAMAHFVAVNRLMGPIGAFFQEDYTLSTSMLSRFYGLHIGLFPLLLAGLAVLHALLVRRLGISPKPGQTEDGYQASLESGGTFLGHLRKLVFYGLGLTAVLVILAMIWTPGLMEAPKAGVEMTKPPWPFWIFYPIESLIGIPGILVGSAVTAAGLLLFPVLGLAMPDGARFRRLVRILVSAGLAAWAVLMTITYFSPAMQHLG